MCPDVLGYILPFLLVSLEKHKSPPLLPLPQCIVDFKKKKKVLGQQRQKAFLFSLWLFEIAVWPWAIFRAFPTQLFPKHKDSASHNVLRKRRSHPSTSFINRKRKKERKTEPVMLPDVRPLLSFHVVQPSKWKTLCSTLCGFLSLSLSRFLLTC